MILSQTVVKSISTQILNDRVSDFSHARSAKGWHCVVSQSEALRDRISAKLLKFLGEIPLE